MKITTAILSTVQRIPNEKELIGANDYNKSKEVSPVWVLLEYKNCHPGI